VGRRYLLGMSLSRSNRLTLLVVIVGALSLLSAMFLIAGSPDHPIYSQLNRYERAHHVHPTIVGYDASFGLSDAIRYVMMIGGVALVIYGVSRYAIQRETAESVEGEEGKERYADLGYTKGQTSPTGVAPIKNDDRR
jgi:hypothetical protein